MGPVLTFSSHTVQVGCLDAGVTVATRVPVSHVIRQDDDHVGCLDVFGFRDTRMEY